MINEADEDNDGTIRLPGIQNPLAVLDSRVLITDGAEDEGQ